MGDANEETEKEEKGEYCLSVENVKELTAKTKVVNRNKELRVLNWVNAQSKISFEEYADPNYTEEEETRGNKRKLDPDDEVVTEPQKKKGRQKMPETHMDCEWVGCRYNTIDYSMFQEHIKTHLPDVIVKSYDNGSSVYVCLWDLCDFETPNDKMIKTHVNYHAYHTMIKAQGKVILPTAGKCYKDSSLRNRIPVLPEEFKCLWKECTLKFTVIQDFFDHVRSHASGERRGRGEMMTCHWMGCPVKKNNPTTFQRHMHTHTLLRKFGCPNCGNTFNDKAAIVTHLERQMKKLDYKCELCPRYYASAALLRAHISDHKKDFKCKDCDTSFNRKSSLASHIRQVHLNIRGLQCNLCSYRCTNKNDMRDHLDRHEKRGRKWIGALEQRLYVCHYCEKNYSRATGLTQHLIKLHGYKQANRSNRYKYVMTEEGVYRLYDFIYGPEDVKHRTEVSLKDILKSDEEKEEGDASQNKQNYNFEIEPKYSLNKENNVKEFVVKQEPQVSEYEKPVTRRSLKKKYTRCHKCKKIVTKDSILNDTHKCDQTETSSVKSANKDSKLVIKKDIKIDPKFVKQELANHIEISIEEIDLQGNIVKIEVVESGEVLAT